MTDGSEALKIVTWNVNSIRVRIGRIADWLRKQQPDVALLQEIKTLEAGFPRLELEALGYQAEIWGEPSYNGVAILSRLPMTDVARGLPGPVEDNEARWIEATVAGIRVVSVYVPNGTSIGSDRFAFKLAYFGRMQARTRTLLDSDQPFVIGGDFNVGPYPIDVYDPQELEGTVCYHKDERQGWRALAFEGLTDAWRALNPRGTDYSWWPYQGRALQADHGLRIDHLMLSPELADRLTAAGIDREERLGKQASDHAPVWCTIGPLPSNRQSLGHRPQAATAA
ncbi:exodeoxyribonuclease III [Marinivivus vitaminiproducens]|uniref:exodeoxyribonuclease III n=1 Tax=Marinivivus vitaminiproducens TaxID=3035935 RepID=UPI0027A67686|nr:exodeoxyribonuclease III [Geminicoccaceae bacterium SCSIO 64248]